MSNDLQITVPVGDTTELGLMRGLDELAKQFNGGRDANEPMTIDAKYYVDRESIRRAVNWLQEKWG